MAAQSESGETDGFRIGVELGSAVEEVVTTILAKLPATEKSERLAWGSLELLAKKKQRIPMNFDSHRQVASASSAESCTCDEDTSATEDGGVRQHTTSTSLTDLSSTSPQPLQVQIRNIRPASRALPSAHGQDRSRKYKMSSSPQSATHHRSLALAPIQPATVHATRPKPTSRPSRQGPCTTGFLHTVKKSLHLLEQRVAGVAEAEAKSVSTRRGRPSERIACAFCKIQKKKCSGNQEECNRCHGSKIYRGLCVPALFDALRSLQRRLYATRIQPLLNNVASPLPFNDANRAVIKISSGFTSKLEIELISYHPVNEDALTHILFRGPAAGQITPSARSTAYALVENTLTREKLDQYCDGLAHELALSDARNGNAKNRLANSVLMFAASRCFELEKNSLQILGLELVRLALRYWVMQALFFKCPWRIENGASSIGMEPLLIPGFWQGKTLLPRLVNQELDRALELRIDELEKEILTKLQRAVYGQHREHWCSIFLTSFILLHSLEEDSWNMHAWEHEKQRPGGTPWPLETSPREYYSQNQHIADVVSTHFRIVSQGHTPFTIDWTKSLNRDLLNDDEGAWKFVSSIQRDLRSAGSWYGGGLRAPTDFSRDDPESLTYLYTKALVLE